MQPYTANIRRSFALTQTSRTYDINSGGRSLSIYSIPFHSTGYMIYMRYMRSHVKHVAFVYKIFPRVIRRVCMYMWASGTSGC